MVLATIKINPSQREKTLTKVAKFWETLGLYENYPHPLTTQWVINGLVRPPR